ncbi:MAG: hypothetical protein KF704_02200 [Crocinitomicaceae bacterium]|nr:hypothetical protein [Crocinitomicaceae bacterium]
MNIGIITYTKYEERVLLNEHFVIDDLLRIVQEDETYRRFRVVDGKGNLLVSTDYRDTGQGAEYLNMARLEKDVETVGTTYDAYKMPSTTHKYKTSWKVNGGICKGKRDAHQYAERINRKARLILERYIGETGV